ncbi:MAG TPA: hypothetical protein V6C95_18260 [Coleofasciculaceae cyanobacterium]
MTDVLGNTPASFFLGTLGTVFLVIAVLGNSKLWIIELNPGFFGRFLGLLLGLAFYAIAFSGSLFPPDFWQTISDVLKTQFQENLKYFVSSILP